MGRGGHGGDVGGAWGEDCGPACGVGGARAGHRLGLAAPSRSRHPRAARRRHTQLRPCPEPVVAAAATAACRRRRRTAWHTGRQAQLASKAVGCCPTRACRGCLLRGLLLHVLVTSWPPPPPRPRDFVASSSTSSCLSRGLPPRPPIRLSAPSSSLRPSCSPRPAFASYAALHRPRPERGATPPPLLMIRSAVVRKPSHLPRCHHACI